MGLRVRLALGLFLLGSLPASACTPLTSAAFPAVMLAYLVWLGLSFAMRGRHGFCNRDLSVYAPTVPLGCAWFAVPVLVLALPFAVLFLAFPMHLAVEFFTAMFSRSAGLKNRGVRLLYYGLPLAIVLFGGIFSKWMLYSDNGGWRVLLVNLSANGPFFGTSSFFIGLIVLARSIRRERQRAKAELSDIGPAESFS